MGENISPPSKMLVANRTVTNLGNFMKNAGTITKKSVERNKSLSKKSGFTTIDEATKPRSTIIYIK